MHVALHLLSQEAQLICEQFEKGLHGVAIMWQTEDLGGVSKNHRVEWSTFLQGENLSETSLLRDFKIICKTGGPPSYPRCLITEGDVSNGLSLVENYLLSRLTPEEAESMEVLIHNHCGQDLTAWIAESGFRKVFVTTEPYHDPHWSCCSFPERCPELLVKCVGDDIQLLLLKHVWPFRSCLPGWRGGYFNLRTFEPAEKNVADSHYIRYTPPFCSVAVAGLLAFAGAYGHAVLRRWSDPGCNNGHFAKYPMAAAQVMRVLIISLRLAYARDLPGLLQLRGVGLKGFEKWIVVQR